MAGQEEKNSNCCCKCKGKKESQSTVDHKEVQLKTLDDLVSVNSLFTIAVFIGLTIQSPQLSNTGIRPECQADPGLGTKVIVHEILAFGCFLFSSLLAKSLKIYLNMFHTNYSGGPIIKPMRGIAFAFSVIGSIVGVALLVLSVTFVLEMKVGKLHCHDTLTAFASFCVIVVIALIVYVVSMFFAIFHCMVF